MAIENGLLTHRANTVEAPESRENALGTYRNVLPLARRNGVRRIVSGLDTFYARRIANGIEVLTAGRDLDAWERHELLDFADHVLTEAPE